MKKRFKLMLVLLLGLLCLSLLMTTYGESAEEADQNVLVIALQPDYFTFDPGYAYELYAPMIIGVTYDTLYEILPDSDFPVAQLASGVEVSEDGLTYTFTINPDAVFAILAMM